MDTFTVRLRTAFAIKLFKNEMITLEKAAKISDLDMETFIERLGQLGISTVNYSSNELKREIKDFGK